MNKRNIILYITGSIIGSISGYLYYLNVGCASGSCAITSSPVNSTIYGLIFGILIASLFTKSKSKQQ